MSIIDEAKEIASLVKKIGDIDLYRRIVELEENIIELTRENVRLSEKCRNLDDLLNTGKKMRYDDPFYYQDGDEVPFCASCWEKGKQALHLTNHHTMKGLWFCQTCNAKYVVKRRE